MKIAIQDLNSPEGMCREKTGDRKGELSETGSDVFFLVFINPSFNLIFTNLFFQSPKVQSNKGLYLFNNCINFCYS